MTRSVSSWRDAEIIALLEVPCEAETVTLRIWRYLRRISPLEGPIRWCSSAGQSLWKEPGWGFSGYVVCCSPMLHRHAQLEGWKCLQSLHESVYACVGVCVCLAKPGHFDGSSELQRPVWGLKFGFKVRLELRSGLGKGQRVSCDG